MPIETRHSRISGGTIADRDIQWVTEWITALRSTSLTWLIALVAVTVQFWPGAAEVLQFDRLSITRGQWWRVFTAHVTHWSTDHLFWDVLMFVVLGTLVEAQSRWRLGGLCLASAFSISCVAWFTRPLFSTYRGLSGVDTALFVYLACRLLLDAIRHRNWRSGLVPGMLLVAVSVKLLFESVTSSTLFVNHEASEFTVFSEAHLLGLLVGILAALFTFSPGCEVRAANDEAPVKKRGYLPGRSPEQHSESPAVKPGRNRNESAGPRRNSERFVAATR